MSVLFQWIVDALNSCLAVFLFPKLDDLLKRFTAASYKNYIIYSMMYCIYLDVYLECGNVYVCHT